jgi:hypothetical protein
MPDGLDRRISDTINYENTRRGSLQHTAARREQRKTILSGVCIPHSPNILDKVRGILELILIAKAYYNLRNRSAGGDELEIE